MTDEQPNTINQGGEENSKPVSPDSQPISDYDKALELVKRREEATKAENDVLDRKEKLAANSMLGGNTGGHVTAKLISPEDKKINNAKEFFKGTALGDAINKVNE